jgi:hypothetical protein
MNIFGFTGSGPANHLDRFAFGSERTSGRIQPTIHLIRIAANARVAAFPTAILLLVPGLVLGVLIPAGGPADIVNAYLDEVGL